MAAQNAVVVWALPALHLSQCVGAAPFPAMLSSVLAGPGPAALVHTSSMCVFEAPGGVPGLETWSSRALPCS